MVAKFYSIVLGNGDIEISPSTVVLSAGQLQSTVAISGIDDSIYEGAEETQLMITTSDKAVIFASPSPTIDVTIVDNDCKDFILLIILACSMCICVCTYSSRVDVF